MEEKVLSYMGSAKLPWKGVKGIHTLADDVPPVANEVVIPSPS
jgi:hypothetical protein